MSKNKFSVNGGFKDALNTVKFLTERKQFINSAEATLPTRTDDFGVNKVAKSLHPKEQKLIISRIEEHADIAKSSQFPALNESFQGWSSRLDDTKPLSFQNRYSSAPESTMVQDFAKLHHYWHQRYKTYQKVLYPQGINPDRFLTKPPDGGLSQKTSFH